MSLKSDILNKIFGGWLKRNPRYCVQYLRLARFLSDNGITPPLSSTTTADDWKHQTPGSRNRNPLVYTKHDNSIDLLFQEVLPLLGKEAAILEIGCNCGRSLKYLHDKGYRNLTGIEIGEEAVNLMKEIFPEVYQSSKIIVGNAVEELKKHESKAYDLVFCHSVLVNIKDNSIFSELTRVCRGYILNTESEGSYKSFPRNFEKMYERVGYKMILQRFCVSLNGRFDFPDKVKYADMLKNNTIRLYAPYCND
ncbi:MAG: class I SAM-dependent methyltransferase [bacterium]